MSKLYTARVLADSKHPEYSGIDRRGHRFNTRLITIEATIPRFILAEFNTHRRLSRNSASSRAIPPEDQLKDGKLIKKGLISRVREEPFVPLKFNKRVKGMGVGAELSAQDTRVSRDAWLWARDQAIKAAEILLDADVDKSRVNRILEPFMPHTIIASGTEWNNFFALRYHPQAQPEFNLCARVMLRAMLESEPTEVSLEDGWHLPLVDPDEMSVDVVNSPSWISEQSLSYEWIWPLISASRCARVSYDTHENFETVEKSLERAKMLVIHGHLSPLEHVARPIKKSTIGESDTGLLTSNFDGWTQLRKLVPMEANRVGFLEGRMNWEDMEMPEIPELEEMVSA